MRTKVKSWKRHKKRILVVLIKGPINPQIGKDEVYEVVAYGKGEINAINHPEIIKWKIFKWHNEQWEEAKGNDKTGRKVTFNFSQKSYTKRLLVEAFIYKPELKAPPGLIVKPCLGPRKIKNTQILNVDGSTITKKPKYGQSVLLRVTTENMLGEILKLSVWDRDTLTDKGHNPEENQLLWSGVSKKVNSKGFAEQTIMLSPSMMQLANKRMFDGSEHEYYVLVESKKMKMISTTTQVSNEIQLSPVASRAPVKKPEPEVEVSLIDQATLSIKNAIEIAKITVEGISSSVVSMPDEVEKEDEKECVCKGANLVWSSKINCQEIKKVIEVAENLGVNPNWLMSVIALETAETFSPSIDNGIGYVGLIQFGKDAATTVATTQAKLIKMTFVEQMDFVQKFLIGKKEKFKTLVDLYLAVLYPKACGHGNEREYVVLDGKAYKNNPMFFKEDDEFIEKIDKKGFIKKVRGPKVDGKTYVWEVDMSIQGVFTKGLGKKTSNFICEFNSELPNYKCKCNKEHINLRDKIKWHSQFDTQWGNKKAQNVACWKASQQILTNSGLGSTSGYPSGAIQLAKEIDNHTKMNYLSDGLKLGIKYLDEQLEKNNPILVGVNHDLNYRGEKNIDHTTDHFVVIVGRGCDTIGAFYYFYEVGTSYKDSGASDENKLYILSDRIEGKTAYNASKKYQISQVRKNN